MKRVIVLGAGRVGATIARDLAPDFDVTVADVRADALERLAPLRTLRADLADPAVVTRLAGEHDLVLGALSSVIGLQTLRAVIEAGKSFVEISFMPEDGRQLDGLARQKGVTCVIDCGVAPGLSNILVAVAARRLKPCERAEIFVGGVPVERRWPYQYSAPFAPSDVIEEYTRPSREKIGGKVVVKEPMTDTVTMDVPGVGTMEAVNTDGLRSLVDMDVPDMREMTMRYPGHYELMRVLRATGFFSQDTIDVKGVKVRPLDVTSALLFPHWGFKPREPDITVMRVQAEGVEGGRRVRLVWDLFDRYDPATDTRSMSRTTAFPATIVARLVASGRFVRPGVAAPEALAADPAIVDEVLAQLAKRDVRIDARVEPL
jgi:saccharopine dehydrogenase-like NADP-dependent oxidoreductase